ncbi:hypothetical protein [Paracoccus cavernae]
MGFTPAQIGQMTPWEYACCFDGWQKAHGGADRGAGKPMSLERLRELGIE